MFGSPPEAVQLRILKHGNSLHVQRKSKNQVARLPAAHRHVGAAPKDLSSQMAACRRASCPGPQCIWERPEPRPSFKGLTQNQPPNPPQMGPSVLMHFINPSFFHLLCPRLRIKSLLEASKKSHTIQKLLCFAQR